MGWITLICALVFVTSAELHQGVMAERPEMVFPKGEQLIIKEGDELRIECRGDGKIQFSTEKLIGSVQQSEFTIESDEYRGKSTFIRPNAIRQDTGWYACAEEGIEIDNTEQTIDHPEEDISWTYVYVTSNTSSFAVKEVQFETIPILIDSDAVIPCRPTSPDLPVELLSSDSVAQLGEDLSYDPRIGFILKNVGLNSVGDPHKCRLKDSHERGGSYVLSADAKGALKDPVIINEGELNHPVWGEDLTLKCILNAARLSNLALNWSLPTWVDRDRLRFSSIQHLTGRDKDTFKVDLTIKDAVESDGGEYTCYASNTHEQSQTSKKIKFWDPRNAHVELTIGTDKSSVISSTGGSAKWKITISTYPADFTYKWCKSDGTEIEATKMRGMSSKYYHEKIGFMDHIFQISHLVIEDSDNYTIRVTASDKEKTVILSLLVEGPPETSISPAPSSFEKGKAFIFSCSTKGSPLPNVTWSYREYPQFPSTDIFVDSLLQNIHGEIKPEKPFQLVSNLNITINTTGELKCTTCNKFACSEDKVHITAVDAPGVFSLTGPDSVADGDDNVRLTCTASRINFTDEITWFVTYPNGVAERIPEKMEIDKYSTNSSTISTLVIPTVSLSDSGIYSCRIMCKETGKKTENHTLNVLEAYKPSITTTNLNNSTMVIKPSKNQTKLTCEADGVPSPNVTWYKDDKLLSNNQYEFSDNNFTLFVRFFDKADCGRYLCRAENRLGTVEHFLDIVIEERLTAQSNLIWIIFICILIIVIVIVITYMGVKVRRENRQDQKSLQSVLKNFEEGAVGSLNPDLTVDEQAELLPYNKKWEFPRELLKVGKQLGSGAFGVVMKAEAQGICVEGETTTVAVKMVRRTADASYMKALASELKIMIHLGRHINVVNLLGACTKTILTKRELYVIVEYCRYGNLHNYLQRHRDHFIDQIDPTTKKIDLTIGLEHLEGRQSVGSQNRSKFSGLPFSTSVSMNSSNGSNDVQLLNYHQESDSGDVSMSPDGGVLSNNSAQPGWRSNYRGDYKDHNLKPICTQDLLCWAWQVARGMEYLSARNVLHGDLAARNILLADDNVVKICDFGLAKNMYKDNNYKKKGDGPLPIKWMAIESIRDRIFSTQSDVWSFGIVLWEFFTLARTPYPGMEAEKLYDKLIEGYRMEKPEHATEEIYDFILSCWQAKPSTRPLFSELVEEIGNLLNERVKIHHMELNTPYMNMNNAALQNGHSDYLTMMSAPNHTYFNSPKPVEVEIHPESAYVSMNRVGKSSQSGISSPSPPREETHFVFPPTENVIVNSGTEHRNESDPRLVNQNAISKPVNVQKLRNDFIRHSNERNVNGGDSPYCNITNNPNYANLANRSSVIATNSNPSTYEIKSQMNNVTPLSPSAINEHESRNNKPAGVSNPGYALTSNNKNKFKEGK